MQPIERLNATVFPLVFLLCSAVTPAAAQDRDWEFIDLPQAATTGAPGFQPALDGIHIDPLTEDAPPTLGELLTSRGLEAALLERGGRRESDAVIEVVDGRLLVRGSAETRDAIRRAAQDIGRELDGLRVPLAVRLGTPDGAEVTIDERQVVRSGTQAAFGTRETVRFLTDFDVEVATSEAVADPIVTSTWVGETVHLWASTRLRADGTREVVVQGLLDIARVVSVGRFDTGVYEFGTIEQPVVRAVQVQFSGSLDASRPLRVKLTGLPAEIGDRTLEIAHTPTGFESNATRIVDLASGLWRTLLLDSHALTGESGASASEREDWEVAAAPTPGSALQLYAAVFGSTTGPRPAFGETIIVLPEVADSHFDGFHAFARDLDPTGPTRFLVVARDGMRAEVPTLAQSLVRVAVTTETVAITEYDPQIANESSLADPRSERIISGFVFEGIAGREEVRGRITDAAADLSKTLDPDSHDYGRLVLPHIQRRATPVRVRPMKPATPFRGVSVSWVAQALRSPDADTKR